LGSKRPEQIEIDFTLVVLKIYGKPVPSSRGYKVTGLKVSKSREPKAHVGSIPTSGTNNFLSPKIV